jgi:hypothetical protein
MTLTEALICMEEPREKQYKLNDVKGLLIAVTPGDSKLWRFDYRFGGIRKSLSLGIYLEVSLREARGKRDELRAKVKSGVDPSEERREAKRNAIKQNKITFHLTLTPSGDLTIMTPIRTITLNPGQTEALRAFLIAASPENKENPC